MQRSGVRKVGLFWCGEPDKEFDLGIRRQHRLSLPRGKHAQENREQSGCSTRTAKGNDVDVVYERCCGLDVHKKTVVACLIARQADGQPHKEVRTFGTMTEDILALADWLTLHSVTHVAMESTGVYWKPIYNLLEGTFDLLLVNAQHIKAVPGRKTDVRDCEWIADLLRHGLLKASFVPDRTLRELRELTRYRTALIRERAAETNRLQKVLEGANIKLAGIVSDILGKSGREMLDALIAGNADVTELAQMARGRMREKIPQLEKALQGDFADHQRFVVARQLVHIDQLDALIDEVSAEITARLTREALPPSSSSSVPPNHDGPAMTAPGGSEATNPVSTPHVGDVVRLTTIPGVGYRTAETLVAEIGFDMTRFPTAKHLAAWAGMAPGNNESAGRRRSGKTRKGSPWLRSALTEAAQAVSHTKNTYLAAQYRRLAARRGRKKAIIAVGHTILVIAYHMLRRQTIYQELGSNYFDEREREGVERRLVRRLEGLGYTVTVERAPAVA